MATTAAKINRTLNALTTHTDGVCDLCQLPVDQHPCAEHMAAKLRTDIDAGLARQAEAWGGIPSQAIEPGVL